MNEVSFLGDDQRLRDLEREFERAPALNGPRLIDHLLQGLSLAKLHRVVERAVLRLSEMEDGRDI